MSVYLAVSILTMRLVLGLVAFILCLSLMMVDEVFEIQKDANLFLKTGNGKTGLGVGDLAVLLLLKKTLPMLRAYYLLLSITFLASLALLPYMVTAGTFALSQVASVVIGFSVSAGILAPFVTTFLFALVEVLVYAIVRGVKTKIFGFPSAHSLISAVSATVRTKISYEKLGDILEERPEEITY
jgi:hypothetical protein